MKKDDLWVFVYFIGISLWLFVITSSVVLIDPNMLLSQKLDLSVPILILIGFYLFYYFMSVFLYVVYLMTATKLERNQMKIKSQFTTYNNSSLCSIIIPARNEESVIRNTVKSCLKQTFRNIEVIVICHNSNDRTFERAHVDDKRVKVFELETKESGKSIALNYGVEHANGEYILIVDADGFMADDFIENALPMFSNGCAAVQGRIRPGNRNYNFITKMLAMEDDLWVAPILTVRQFFGNRCPLGGTGFIIRKDILIRIGMFKNHLVDDAELTYRLFKEKYKISYAPLSLVYGEEPPAIDIMIRQRARWAKGFLSLLSHSLADPRDIIGSIYWLLPIATYSGLGIFFIIAYASLHMLLLGYAPYGFYYLPITVWFLLAGLNFVLSMLVLMKQHGLKGLKYALYFPIYLIFSQYSLATNTRAFFIKSWGTTKTMHGFTEKSKIETYS
jgi:cellulose synthase/poly-beta-1,6-N-acetylglucosamine synthase-like glycosyltransferase